MSRETFPHYVCESCKSEVVERKPSDIKTWIVITSGATPFSRNNPLTIGYMVKDYKYESANNRIEDDIHFCCKECLVKWLYTRLGATKSETVNVIKEAGSNQKKEPEKQERPVTRFNDLELVNNADEQD